MATLSGCCVLMHRGIRCVGCNEGAAAVAARSFTRWTLRNPARRFNAERPLRKERSRVNSQLFLKTAALPTGIHVVNERQERQIPHPPSYPREDGTGPQEVRSRPGVGTEAGWVPHHPRRLRRLLRLFEPEPLRDERAAPARDGGRGRGERNDRNSYLRGLDRQH